MSLPNRKSPRLQGYDYAQNGMYFVTICTHDKKCLFGTVKMLNTYGCIAQQAVLDLHTHYQGVSVDKFVIMPNHIHAIICIENGSVSLSAVVGGLKSSVSKSIHITDPTMQVWQKSFYDHVIRNEKTYLEVWRYIDENPLRWDNDEYYVR